MIKNISCVYDEFLAIKTEIDSADSGIARKIYIDYGPTCYSVLEDLFVKYPFAQNDHFVDFGCGKGRVLIMAAYHGCAMLTGYELATDRYEILTSNVRSFKGKHETTSVFSLLNENVEDISIPDTTNKFFFTNSFHLKVHMKILDKIHSSLLREKREILLFFHRPDDSIVKYVDRLDSFEKIDLADYRYWPDINAHKYFELVVYKNI